MSMMMLQRIKALELKVAELEQRLAELKPEPEQKRKLCPHCNAAPAYHFHVMHCSANKNKKNGADDRRRDPGTS